MHLLFITQKVDRADWLLGFTHGWIKSLAKHVEQLTVICLAQGETDLPPNVRVISLGKERGVGRLGRAIKFIQVVAATIREADGVFAHMSPIFAIAAAPFTKFHRKHLVLWYTHRGVDFKLRLATALCDTVVTASPESFQLPTPKLRVLGHGIDPDQFSPKARAGSPDPAQGAPLILAVGRLSPIKRYELLIAAVKLLRARGVNVRCVIAGGDPPGDRTYGDSLRAMGHGVVEFVGSVPHAQIAAWYHRCSVAVNLCPTGGLDKAVLEAIFCGCPIVVTNRGFALLLGEEGEAWVVAEEPDSVAQALASILANGHQARMERVQARARAEHRLEGLVERLLAVFGDSGAKKK